MSRGPLVEEFGALLRRCREEAGFSTPAAFFRAHGAAFLGCGERAYRNLESGRALPSPRVMTRLAAVLRLALREELGRRAALAYLRALIADESFLSFLSEAAEGEGAASPPATGRAEPSGDPVFEHPLLLRASEAELSAYWPFVAGSLARCAAAAAKAGGTKRRYVAEVSLRRLARF